MQCGVTCCCVTGCACVTHHTPSEGNSIRDTFFFFFFLQHPFQRAIWVTPDCPEFMHSGSRCSLRWMDWFAVAVALTKKKKAREGKKKKRKEKGTAGSHTGVWILTVSFSALRSRSEMIPLWTWPYLCLTYLKHHKCNRPPGRHKTHFLQSPFLFFSN